MPTDQEFNQFRRLIGDFPDAKVGDEECQSWLDDATAELAVDFATPIFALDIMPWSTHSEIIHKAAINFWWNQLSKLQTRISMNIGNQSANYDQLWQRALQMIQELEERYENTRTLGYDIHVDNYSRWSKISLRRIGGINEEDTPGIGGNLGT